MKSKDLSWLLEQSVDTKLSLVQHHLSLVRLLVNEILSEDVETFCGKRYSYEKPKGGRYSRWGYNPGSVKVGNQQIKISVPRIYDNEEQQNKPLESYKELRELKDVDQSLSHAILHGLSMGDYGQVINTLYDSFGLSRSSVSKKFIEQSSEKLAEFEKRSLHSYEFVGIFIDGKSLAKEQIIIVLGVSKT